MRSAVLTFSVVAYEVASRLRSGGSWPSSTREVVWRPPAMKPIIPGAPSVPVGTAMVTGPDWEPKVRAVSARALAGTRTVTATSEVPGSQEESRMAIR
jgi:hypothetical protein